MCSGFVLEPFGHRQGRRGKVLTVSVDRVGGSTGIGGGADRGMATHASWHQRSGGPFGGPATRASLVTTGTSFCYERRFITRS